MGYLKLPDFSSRKMISAVVSLAFVVVLLNFTLGESQADRTVVLPNGMMVMRTFDVSGQGHSDLFAGNGDTRLARNLEFVCFNDRYVWASSYQRSETGLFDSVVGAKLDGMSTKEAFAVSGLGAKNHSCNGYYKVMVGPDLLFDGNTSSLLPSCDQRNLDNPTLLRRDWFRRPCSGNR